MFRLVFYVYISFLLWAVPLESPDTSVHASREGLCSTQGVSVRQRPGPCLHVVHMQAAVYSMKKGLCWIAGKQRKNLKRKNTFKLKH